MPRRRSARKGALDGLMRAGKSIGDGLGYGPTRGADAAPSETSADRALSSDRRRGVDGELRPVSHVRLDGGARRRHLPHQPRRPAGLDNMDPALSFTPPGWALLDTVCARLMAYPDKRPPAGLRLRPRSRRRRRRVARTKTFTFTLRHGLPLQRREPRSRERVRTCDQPGARTGQNSPGACSPATSSARPTSVRESAQGDRRRGPWQHADRSLHSSRAGVPGPDGAAVLLRRPPTLPPDAEGSASSRRPGRTASPSTGPASGSRSAETRSTAARRPHHVDGFDVDLRAASPDERSGSSSGARPTGATPDAGVPQLGARAGGKVRHQPLAVLLQPGLTLRMFVFNSSRPLFRNNPALRKAVNFALDRKALQALSGGAQAGRLTDQYIPPLVRGFRDGDVYPLERRRSGAGTRARARQPSGRQGGPLHDRLRSPARPRAARQAAAGGDRARDRDQARPGAHRQRGYLDRLAEPGAEWDIALVVWTPTSRSVGVSQPAARRASTSAAPTSPASRRRHTTARYGARHECRRPVSDSSPTAPSTCRLARDAAPLAAFSVLNEPTFVSERVDRAASCFGPRSC